MKKKMGLILCILALCLAAGCGNGGETTRRVNNQSKSVSDVLKEEMAKEDAKTESSASVEAGPESGEAEPVSETVVSIEPEADNTADQGNTAASTETSLPAGEAGQTGESGDTNGDATANGPVRDNTPVAAADLKKGAPVDVDLTELSGTMVYSEVLNMMTLPDDYIGKTVRMSGLFATYHDDVSGNDYYACVIQDATACCAQGIEFILNKDYSYPEGLKEVCVAGTFDTYWEGELRYCTLRNATLESEKDAAIE